MFDARKDKLISGGINDDITRSTSRRMDIQTRLKKINQQFRQQYENAKSMSKVFMNSTLQENRTKEIAQKAEANQKIIQQKKIKQREMKYGQKYQNKQQLKKEISQILDSSRNPNREDRSPQKNKERVKTQIFNHKILQQSPLNTNRQKRQLSSKKSSEQISVYLSQYKLRLQKQKQQREQLQSICRRLQFQNSKLLSQLATKNKYKQQIVSSWKDQKQMLENQILQLKTEIESQDNRLQHQAQAYQQRILILQEEVQGLRSKVANAVIYEGWTLQKSKLLRQIDMFKTLIKQKDEQKLVNTKYQKEIQRLQKQHQKTINIISLQKQKIIQNLLESQTIREELFSRSQTLSQQLKSIKQLQSKKSTQMKSYEQQIQSQKENLHIKTIQNSRLQSLYNNIKCQLQSIKQQNSSIFQSHKTLLTLQNKLLQQQNMNDCLSQTLHDLQRSSQQITLKLAQEMKLNSELQQQFRSKILQHQSTQTEMENMFMEKIKQIEQQLITLRDQKASTLSMAYESKLDQQKQLHELKAQNQYLLKELSQSNKKLQDYEFKNNQLSPITDSIMKQQMKQNESLKDSIKIQVQQIVQLKQLLQQTKRKYQNQKTEFSMFKLKSVSDFNKQKKQYVIKIEELLLKVQNVQKKYEILLSKQEKQGDELNESNINHNNNMIEKISISQEQEQQIQIRIVEQKRIFLKFEIDNSNSNSNNSNEDELKQQQILDQKQISYEKQ